MDKIMNEIYESGFKIGKKYYRDQIVNFKDCIDNGLCDGYIPYNVMQSITDLFIEEKRDIPKELFFSNETVHIFLVGLYNGSKKYRRNKRKE